MKSAFITKKKKDNPDRVLNTVMRGISSQLDLEEDEKSKKKLLRKRAIIKKMKLSKDK
jgi:hypothetical protein